MCVYVRLSVCMCVRESLRVSFALYPQLKIYLFLYVFSTLPLLFYFYLRAKYTSFVFFMLKVKVEIVTNIASCFRVIVYCRRCTALRLLRQLQLQL